MRRTRFLVPAAAAPLLALAVGCSAFFDAPVVRISDVRVIGVGLSGATAEVELSVVNPNTFDLRSKELRYRVEYEDPDARPAGGDPEEDSVERAAEPTAWRLLVEGTSEERVSVPADDSATVRLAVPFRYSDLGRAVLGLVRTGSLSYRVTGDVLFDGPVGDFRVPFEDTGTLAPAPDDR